MDNPSGGVATNLVGKHATWDDSYHGRRSGPIMAVFPGYNGRAVLLVLINGRLVEKDAEGVNVELAIGRRRDDAGAAR